MKLHIFQSSREPDVFGFTADEAGNNLPSEFSPWLEPGNGGETETSLGSSMMRDGSSGPIFTAIQRDGFYVARSETLSRATGIPWVG